MWRVFAGMPAEFIVFSVVAFTLLSTLFLLIGRRSFWLPCRFRGWTRARLATLGTVQPRNRPHNDHPVHKVDLAPRPRADMPIGS
ncbi:hypothetical protein OG558_04750 [Kribbella sp. NBC_01510]|uniref:hypothetical protein n=1 Tax=Kribbella sp. NBC_01510 TaxID=2903581 RepID=UPI00386AE156